MSIIRENSWQKQNTLVLYDPEFHEGVLGLVANKIVEKTHKPTIVLTKNDVGKLKDPDVHSMVLIYLMHLIH